MTQPTLFDPFEALATAKRRAAHSAEKGPRETFAEVSQATQGRIVKQNQQLTDDFATFAAFAGGAQADDSSRPSLYLERKKDFSLSFQGVSQGSAGSVVGSDPASDANDRTPPAKAAKLRNESLSHCSTKEVDEGAAAQFSQLPHAPAPAPSQGAAKVAANAAGLVDAWSAAIAALSPEQSPCPGYRGSEWARVRSRALTFLDVFGEQAVALGWTASGLFGVHPEAGAIRVDACGALMVGPGADARAITADTVSFGHLTYRVKPGQPAGVPVWEFGR